MNEKKMLADEELEQVSGGRSLVTQEENCGKWWECTKTFVLAEAGTYAYIHNCDGSSYTATLYAIKNGTVYNGRIYINPTMLFAFYSERNVSDVPQAIRQVAGC